MSNRMIGGAAVMLGAQLLRRALDLILMIVLARILIPEDFGLVAIAVSAMLVFMAAANVQLSDALVQMEDPRDEHYNTAFTLALIRSLLIYACLYALSWILSWIYGDPRLQPVLAVIGLAPAIRGMVSPKMAVFIRTISFVPETVNEIGSKLVSFAAAAAIALQTESYWALVAGQVAAPLVYTLLSYVRAPMRPRLTLVAWRELIGFSGWISLQRLVSVLNFNLDRFLIGGRLGASQLGVYVIGSDWSALPTQTMQEPLSKVLFAGLAKKNNEGAALASAYLQAQAAAGALLLPTGIGMALIAHYLIPLAIGPDWEQAILIIQILAPLFAVQSLAAPAQAMAMARGATRAIFNRDMVNLAVRIPLIIVGVFTFGLIGVLVARVLSGLNITLLNMILVRRLVGLPVLTQVLSMRRSILSGVGMCVTVMALQHWMDRQTADLLIKLLGTILAGILSYTFWHFLFWILAGRPFGPETRALHVFSRLTQRKGKLT